MRSSRALVLDLLGVALCDDSTLCAGSFLAVDSSCRGRLFYDAVVQRRSVFPRRHGVGSLDPAPASFLVSVVSPRNLRCRRIWVGLRKCRC